MNVKAKEKRKLRGYKAMDKPYRKAIKRADKEGVPLATLIEQWVIWYSEGEDVGKIESLDINALDQ